MSELNPFSENILRLVVAQIFKTVGWDTMSSVCLNVLTDVLHRHIKELCDMLRDLSDTVGVAEPSISEVVLLFRKLGINFENLGEYIDIADTPVIEPAIPKYPIPKPPSLNLLKPGSKEMVTRPVHIHEHLPPMYPELEDASEAETVNSVPGTSSGPSSSRRGTVNDMEDHVAQLNKENMMQMEVGRPMRQLTCVTMTSSGFLSSSCEGRLAESRLPLQYVEREESPEVTPEPKIKSKHTRKPSSESLKLIEKKKIEEGKSSENGDHLNKPHLSKELHAKSKTHKHRHHTVTSEDESMEPKPSKSKSAAHVNGTQKEKSHHKKKKKHNKEMTGTKIDDMGFAGEKLTTEPNKRKLNILKVISKIKDGRHDSRHKIDEDITPASQLDTFKISPMEMVTAKINRKRQPETTSHTIEVPEVPKKKRGRKKKIRPAEEIIPVPIPEIVEETVEEEIAIEPEIEIPHVSPGISKFSRLPDFLNSGPGLIPNINLSSIMPPMSAYGGMKGNDNQKKAKQGLQFQFHTPIRTKEDRYSTVDEDGTTIDSEKSDEKKMKKEHKKMKKEKKEKEKKKKEKKHKNKDKEEKKKEKLLKKLKNKEKSKLKKEKKRLEEQPETSVPKLKLTLGMPSPQLSPSSMQPKIVIKPVIDYSGGNVTQYEQNERFSSKREHDPSPERNAKRHKHKSKTHDDPLATTSGMVETFALPQAKPKANPLIFDTTKPKRGPGRPRKNENQQRPQNKRTVAFYYDSTGNQIWICPSCGAQDDGSPMVGCDGCDAWFHWVCVGMTAAPESKKWFCPLCLG